MPTLPSQQPEPIQGEPHHARGMAESFGTDARRYDRARPGYPDALVARIVGGSPGPDVLDVGCGTGIAARQFQAAGCTVLGVEPDARMADYARESGVEVEVATFEAWEPAGRTFDAVIAAQSWHWVDPDTGAVKAAQVLHPNGRLAMFGHVFEPPAEVAEPFAAAYRRLVPDSPFSNQPARRPLELYQAAYTKLADTIRRTRRFSDPEQWRFDWRGATPATNG
jgi:SAM-dependent methyltransferase